MSYNKSFLMPVSGDSNTLSDIAILATLNDAQRSLLVTKLQEIIFSLEPKSDACRLSYQLLYDMSFSVETDDSFSLNQPGSYEFQLLSPKSRTAVPSSKKSAKLRKINHKQKRPHRILMNYKARTALIVNEDLNTLSLKVASSLVPHIVKSALNTFNPTEDIQYYVNLFDKKLADRIEETAEMRAENKYQVLVEGDERFLGFD